MLAERDDKGFTYREHLETLSDRRGERHPDLDGPPLPPAGRHVWAWFCDLARTTGDGPLSYPDLDAWSRLTGVRPRPWEIALLTAIDALGRRLTVEAHDRQRQGRLDDRTPDVRSSSTTPATSRLRGASSRPTRRSPTHRSRSSTPSAKMVPATTGAAAAFDRLKRTLDPVYDAQKKIEKATRDADAAIRAGRATAADKAAILGKLTAQLTPATGGMRSLATISDQLKAQPDRPRRPTRHGRLALFRRSAPRAWWRPASSGQWSPPWSPSPATLTKQ